MKIRRRSKDLSLQCASRSDRRVARFNVGHEPLTPYVHPAELDRLACSDLHQLFRSVGRTRRELAFLNQDLTRVTQYGKKPLYLLDFSELHAHLWPETSRSQHKALLQYLLSGTTLDFALPPGAVIELAHKLSELVTEQTRDRAAIAELLDRPFVQSVLRMYAEPDPSGRIFPDFAAPIMDEIVGRIRGIRAADEGLDRLARLYETGRLKPLSSFVKPNAVLPDPEILREAYFQLISYRPTRDDIVNYIDAHNYAIAYGLNNKFYESMHLFFLLVTASPVPYTIFESMKWKEDPLFAAAAEKVFSFRTSLVRHPVQLMYFNYLTSFGTSSLRMIRNADVDLEALQKGWSKIPAYDRYTQKKDIPGSTAVRLPRNRDYLKHISRFQQ